MIADTEIAKISVFYFDVVHNINWLYRPMLLMLVSKPDSDFDQLRARESVDYP